jgi:hypothetical protein
MTNQFIDKELRDTIATINSIIKKCWNESDYENSTNQDRYKWTSLAKDACLLKADILTNSPFLKTARRKKKK